MTVLPNNKAYDVAKGNKYLRYSDSSFGAKSMDAGYPYLPQSNWGNLNADFASGFDSIWQS